MSRQLRRLLERELVSGLGRGRRRTLVERLRGNSDARRSWDRALTAFRALEQREVSHFELDQVERWLFDDLEDAGVVAPGPLDAHADAANTGRSRWTWLAASTASLASAAALLVWVGVGEDSTSTATTTTSVEDGTLTARGAHDWARPLALELVCGQPAHPAARGGCALDEPLGFSARLGDEGLEPRAAAVLGEAALQLTVFGLDAKGELLYYAPTPASVELPLVELGADWQALPMSVRLDVNHAPGSVRVFALASELSPSLAQLEGWAAALAPAAPATLDDAPWHLRVPVAALRGVCPRLQRCASAETQFEILPVDAGTHRPTTEPRP